MTNPKGLLAAVAILFSFDVTFGSSHIYVKGYTTISNGKGTTLTINTRSRSFVLKKPNGTLRLSKLNGASIFTFTTTKPGSFTYRMNLKVRNGDSVAGLAKFKNEIMFSSECGDQENIKKFSKSVSTITEFLSKATEPANAVSLLDQSCNSSLNVMERKNLNKVAHSLFKPESVLVQCLNNDVAMGKLSTLPDASANIDLIVNEVMNTQASIAKGESSILISCEETTPPGSFNAKYFENKITVPVSENMLIANQCSPLAVTLAHEVMHKSGITNEKTVHAIQSICMGATHADLKGTCAKQFECSDDPKKCSNLAAQDAITQTIKLEQDQTQPQVVEILNNQLAKNDIKEINVSDSDWKTLQESESTGQSGSITRSIASTMSGNFDRMAGVVNQAIGAIESPAYAGSSATLASRSNSSESAVKNTFKSASANNEKYYTTEEYLADKFPIAQKRGIASSGALMKTEGSNVARTGPVANENVATNDTGELGNEAAIGVARASGLSSRTSGTQSAPTSPQTARGIANESASQPIAVLQQKEIVSGAEYASIKKLYNSSSFKRDLVSQGIMISIPEDGINIGMTPSRATLKLVDDGSSIRRTGAR